MSFIDYIFLAVHVLFSFIYIAVISIIMPRVSKKDSKKTYSFPKEPVIFYLGFYIVSTIILMYILQMGEDLTIIINLQLLAIGHFFGRKLRLIGISGQICSGKSIVCRYLAERYNSIVIPSEEIEEILLDDKELKQKLIKKFGDKIIDPKSNKINKFSLLQSIAEKPKVNISLNYKTAIKFFCYVLKIIITEKFSGTKRFVFLEFDLLLKFRFLCNLCYPIVSICNPNKEITINRIMEKYNFNLEQATFLFHNQISLEEMKKKSEKVIFNEGTAEEINRKIERFISKRFLC